MVVIMIILLRQVVTGQVNGAVRERERGKVWAVCFGISNTRSQTHQLP